MTPTPDNPQYHQSPKPEWRKSKMGYDFDVNADHWQLDGSINLTLTNSRALDKPTALGLRLALSRYAQELAAGTTSHCQSYFYMYCDWTGERTVTVSGLTKWRSMLTDATEYYLGSLKSFLISWYEWGFPGINSDVVKYLDELRLKGIEKGKAVKGACPYSGPLTLQEQAALLEWASNAFSNAQLNLKEYAFFLALMFTGRRAVQIRSLRACDLIAREDKAGREYVVNVPRVKQHGMGFREAFSSLPVVEDLYLLLVHQADASQAAIEDVLGVTLAPTLKAKIPVFLEETRVSDLTTIQDLVRELERRPDYLHMKFNTGLKLVGTVAEKNTARSERTGDYINFTSRRFRYTKGTNLSRRGIQGVALATALDHSDTQNIGVYAENTVETAGQIDEIMAPILAPLAQAFAGKLIASEREALRANDPHSRINNGEHNIGSCGTYGFCGSGYRGCYTCVNFEAWKDAPHEEVRDEILAERERQRQVGVSPFVIQSTDRLLLAVEKVIELCKKAKAIDAEVEYADE